MGSRRPHSPKPTAAQMRRIWAFRGDLERSGLQRCDAEDVIRQAVELVTGQRSTQKLTRDTAAAVISELEGQVEPTRPRQERALPEQRHASANNRDGRITPEMNEVVVGLFNLIGWTDQRRRTAFCQRQCKAFWPQTMREADQVIEPLKAMALRHLSPAEAWKRTQALVDHPVLDGWKRRFIADLNRQFRKAHRDDCLDKVMTPRKLEKLIEAEAWVEVRRA